MRKLGYIIGWIIGLILRPFYKAIKKLLDIESPSGESEDKRSERN